MNRSKVAEAVFGASNQKGGSRVQELNRIVHPAVIKRQEEWMDEIGRKQPHGIAMVEAALIVEAGAAKRFDRLIMVTCQPEQRFQRWAELRKVDQKAAAREVTRRMAAQLPDEEKIKLADYVIDNSGSLDSAEASHPGVQGTEATGREELSAAFLAGLSQNSCWETFRISSKSVAEGFNYEAAATRSCGRDS